MQTQGGKNVSAIGGQLSYEQDNSRFVMFDGTVYRMIFGLLPDGTIGFIISKEGVDVFSLFT